MMCCRSVQAVTKTHKLCDECSAETHICYYTEVFFSFALRYDTTTSKPYRLSFLIKCNKQISWDFQCLQARACLRLTADVCITGLFRLFEMEIYRKVMNNKYFSHCRKVSIDLSLEKQSFVLTGLMN